MDSPQQVRYQVNNAENTLDNLKDYHNYGIGWLSFHFNKAARRLHCRRSGMAIMKVSLLLVKKKQAAGRVSARQPYIK
ncbi:MAG: hypothetical protein IJO38_06470 [Akkermansia sp.]|nr:hypothetical protein [Akkermansia sp.]